MCARSEDAVFARSGTRFPKDDYTALPEGKARYAAERIEERPKKQHEIIEFVPKKLSAQLVDTCHTTDMMRRA
jgi:hypothetical protein